MGAIPDKVLEVAELVSQLGPIKTGIKNAIEAQGVTVGDTPFAEYPDKIAAIEGGGGGDGGDPWERPSDWLEMPTIGPTEAKLVGLVAVFDTDANYVSLTAAGAYTVDWGDGTTPQSIASGVAAHHQYDYANLDEGTLCSRGYKQAIITVTPTSTLTYIAIGTRPPQYTAAKPSLWLEVAVGGPNLNGFGSAGMMHALLERIELVSHAMTSASSLFLGLSWLRALKADLAAIADATSMCNSCAALEMVEITAAPSLVNATDMFVSCSRLLKVVLPATPSLTYASGMFNGCSMLEVPPLVNTTNVTNLSSFFQGCAKMRVAPAIDTGNATNLNSLFNGCSNLEAVPLYDTSKATSMANMFTNCIRLQTVPPLDTSAATSLGSAFQGCTLLTSIPPLTLKAGAAVAGMFQNCSNLQRVPLLDVSAITNFASIFTNCASLAVGALSGTSAAISYANCRLSRDALVEIFTNLADRTSTSSAAITITGNYGVADLITADRDIALDKNWTITG